jgi:uncharacterized protein (DUF1501 family)
MTISRRDFLASGLAAAGTGLIVPPAFAKGVFAATAEGIHNNRVLVILQLGGGNDGLNTVVPLADAAYHDARPTIGITPDKALRLNDRVGLNPVMPGLKGLFDAGHLAVVQGVGYPQPTYSHFEGLHVWEHADPARRNPDGWLGKLMQTQYDTQGHPLTGCALGQAGTPTELRADKATVSVIQSADAYQVQGGQGRNIAVDNLYKKTPGLYGALFDTALSTARTGIDALHNSKYTPMATYAQSKAVYGSKDNLGQAMQLAAQMIITQPDVKICHVVLGGFDTHQAEDTRQAALLANVDTALTAFMTDLEKHGHADRVVVMTWSEFGRRVHENGSKGTDHGAAAPMFIVGKPISGGVYGEHPSLTALDNGNLKFTTDFRSVYQTLIRDWLQGDSASVLGGNFPELKFVRA